MSDIVHSYTVSVDQVRDYQFLVTFDKEQYAALAMDEPAPLGGDTAPGAGRVLAAAVGNCLGASFLFAARKAGVEVTGIHAEVAVEVVRNERRRLRIGRIAVTLDPKITPGDAAKAESVRGIFEDFCTITASVRQGVPVDVTVKGLDNEHPA